MSLSHPKLDLSRPRLMAIVNATPDSFSDGGLLFRNDKIAVDLIGPRIDLLVNEGADILDIGGESTRPGAVPVGLQQELDRVMPIVEWAAANTDSAISVDTSSAQVMAEAASKGAHMINDVRALTRPNALQVAASSDLFVCLMHMQGTPETMQAKPNYQSVCKEVVAFLQQRVTACIEAGIAREKIYLDPGFGFGKSLDHNLSLLRNMSDLVSLGLPIVAGFSRKSMLGKLLGRDTGDRLAGSLALAVMALERGVRILRVHDVAATRDIIDTVIAVTQQPAAG